ncbi:MAG: cellulase family glycosylhydrolase, partial [Sedimentisphaerales bacterium]|nr:cellulase family glycosylhydrolase [Sedimentisphaerales bacterium]
IDLGFLEDWQGGVINMIDRLTDKTDDQGSSPGWYPRVLRLAIVPEDAADNWPHPFDPNDDDFYNTILRPAVDYCAEKDLYAIIDWHYVANTYEHLETTSAFWEYMAPRFANDSHVIFELFNEPINDVDSDWIFNDNDINDWLSVRTDMQTWIDIVRTYAPNNPILVAGPFYSQAIGPTADYPVSDPIGSDNIAYVSHIYPGHWLDEYWGSRYKDQITTCKEVFPVFMTEWGFSMSSDEGNLESTISNYGQPLMDFVEELKISHTAWVASYDWRPTMFNRDWTLRCGEGEMGCFVKDMLYAKRFYDQPGGSDIVPPAAPTGLNATEGDGLVSLDWNKNTEKDLAGYNIYRSTSTDSGYLRLNDTLLMDPYYDDYDVINLTTYYYYATAVIVNTDSIESLYSDKVSAIPYDGLHLILNAADFESDFGQWGNVTDDSHDWSRISGSTPSGRTGPEGGANSSTWYVYLETSSFGGGAGDPNDTAYLEGPEFDGLDRILTFYYHMYGENIGTLNVDVFDGAWHNGIWNLSGQQQSSNSDPYLQASVDLSDYSGPIRIRLRAVAAGGSRGDIAIDEIKVIGIMNHLTNPGFENGTIGWADRYCSIETVTSPARSGIYSGRVYNRTAGWQGILQDIMGIMREGQTCTISGWVRLENTSSADVSLTVQQTDNSGTHYHQLASTTCYDDSWTYLSGDFTLDTDGILSGLYLYFEGPDSGVSFFVDDTALIGPGIDPGSAQGLVDVTTRHQMIEGFGAAGAWYESWLTDHPLKTEIYDTLFGQLGLDIYRIRNVYDQSSNDYMSRSAQIIAAGEESLGRPLKVMISCWSPPAYLKSNDSLNRGTLKKDDNGDYMYDELADWWADSLDAWRGTYGIDADYFNIQNEPDWVADWDTCEYSGSETDTLAGYNQAFEAVWQEVNSRMGSSMPKMLAAEAAGIPNSAEYLDNLIDTSHVYGYSHHLYNINSGAYPDGYNNAMAEFSEKYGDRPLFQTEYEASTDSWPDAMNLALLLHNSLTVEGVSGYLYWDLFWGGSGGLVTLDNPWSGDPNFTINSDYYGFKHYSAFIHSGWQRVDTTVDTYNPRISAYISPDNQQLSVILINTDAGNDIDFDLSFDGVDIDEGNIYRTSQTENCVLVGSFDTENTLTLPAYSITTLDLSITPGYQVAEAEVEMKLKCKPGNLKPNTKSTTVTAKFTTPKGIGEDDIDLSEPITFYPGEIEALELDIKEKGKGEKVKTTVTATFDASDCMENLQAGKNTVYVVGKLITGQYFEATGSMKYTPE